MALISDPQAILLLISAQEEWCTLRLALAHQRHLHLPPPPARQTASSYSTSATHHHHTK